MKICTPHWERLRAALKERGLDHLGAKTGEAAAANMVTELEGRSAENDFDPLMAANNMIWTQGLKVCGLALMANNEDGSEKCPICESAKAFEQDWITGPSDAVLGIAKEKGLV